jgi:hypothetical protein
MTAEQDHASFLIGRLPKSLNHCSMELLRALNTLFALSASSDLRRESYPQSNP